jgi:hypothetical protein
LKQADRAVDEGLIEEDENENEEGDLEEPTSAYTTLLQTLQATSGSFSRAIAQRVHDFVFCDILLGGERSKERVAAARRMRKQAVILKGHQTLTQWQLLKKVKRMMKMSEVKRMLKPWNLRR